MMLDLESLFKLSYGMYIVSSARDGRNNGCIANTVFQVIPDPAMVAVSINKKNLTHEYISSRGAFTISVLGRDTPMSFIGKFGFRSGRDIDKFEQVSWKKGQTALPIILDWSVSFIEAEVEQIIDVVTRTLFTGRIIACETIDQNRIPMTYAYYRDVKQGRTPETAATYIKTKDRQKILYGELEK